jgi:hypothetical protein
MKGIGTDREQAEAGMKDIGNLTEVGGDGIEAVGNKKVQGTRVETNFLFLVCLFLVFLIVISLAC